VQLFAYREQGYLHAAEDFGDLQDMAFGLACFMLEYFSYEGEEISKDPTTMRTLTTSANGQVWLDLSFKRDDGIFGTLPLQCWVSEEAKRRMHSAMSYSNHSWPLYHIQSTPATLGMRSAILGVSTATLGMRSDDPCIEKRNHTSDGR